MEQETLAQIDQAKTEQAEEAVADFLFGAEPQEEPKEEGEPAAGDEREVAPVVEGEEPEEAEASEEEEKADDKDEDSEEVEFVEMEIDGKLYEVPSELKDRIMMQEDYTRKTQEVAAQRKETEARIAAIEQRAQEFEFAESLREDILQAEMLDNQIKQYETALSDYVNSPEFSAQTVEQARVEMNKLKAQKDEIIGSIQGKQQEFQQAREQSRTELLKQGTEILKSKIPEWGESHQKQVRDYASAIGFTDAEIGSVVDPRQVEVLYKASQYDALQKGKTSAVKKVQKAPTIKPRARDPKSGKFVKQEKLKKALKSNLPADKKANLIGDDIASRFF